MTDLQFDMLQMYYEKPFQLTDKIVIRQPTVGEIMDHGESSFYDAVRIFVANPTMYRLFLWDIGIDWNKISEFALFSILMVNLRIEDTRLLFGDIDFSLFEPKPINEAEPDKFILYNEQQDIVITEEVHKVLTNYIRTMFNIFPKVEKAKGKLTKQSIIDEDRAKHNENKDKPIRSDLLPLISACVNHPGFKYKKKELIDVGIVEFMDSVQRLQVYESTNALLKGVYSGFLDTKKINNDELNFMRDLQNKS